ncbi:class A beta-lactamase [Streptomyces sp. ODS28]|uniref:class A beta-lactamase n=1 Tax=Streptomyces sp. ODS28 TaxID=3136688 RepID=UPI0031F074F8
MPRTTTLRGSLAALCALTLVPLAACTQEADGAPARDTTDAAFKKLEGKYDARLGVYAVDTGSGRSVSYNADRRFAYASSHKAFSAAAVLRSHSDKELDKRLHYTRDEVLPHSPVTEKHVRDGVTVRQAAAAAVQHSDNTAANLLFEEIGGPKKLGAFLAGLGDGTTRVSRVEPDLNEAAPGDTRDTTTPRAFTEDLRKVALGKVLGKGDRARLLHWMGDNSTGATLTEAGVPKSWKVAGKSGGGRYASRNDITVVTPPGHAPLVMSIMSRRGERDAAYDDKLISSAARTVADELS